MRADHTGWPHRFQRRPRSRHRRRLGAERLVRGSGVGRVEHQRPQGDRDLRRRRALLGPLAHAGPADLGQRAGQAENEQHGGRGDVPHPGRVQLGVRRGGLVRGVAGEHLVQQDTQGVHVVGRPDRAADPAGGQRLLGGQRRGGLDRDRFTEVDDLRSGLGHHDVGRGQVAVDHSAPVGDRQHVGDGRGHLDRLRPGQRATGEPAGQHRAGQQFHGDVGHHPAVGQLRVAEVVDLRHARMPQPGGDQGFLADPLPRVLVVGERRGQQLDRRAAAPERVDGLIYNGNPAVSHRADEDVPANDGRAHPQRQHRATISYPEGAEQEATHQVCQAFPDR